ncbi:PREDICTED: homeobox-DDT domain protein RLT2-like isoform X2 [Tarenaya hassleriana]|nr:PREDICTED: homeobox-DDT domain protein RLT2-like isoform X2 [Tarenaya hassleriana]
MWFCHRRLKDRKRQRKVSTAMESKAAANGNELTAAVEAGKEPTSFGNELDTRRAVVRSSMAVPRVGRWHNEPSPQMAAELRAIGFVEAQLGERLREDGPILGMEFDPLPPGAFGTPIETPSHPKPPGHSLESHFYERADAKSVKDRVRPIREYQFLPEQPSSRVSPPHHSGVALDVSVIRATSVPCGHLYSHRDENVPYGYGHSAQTPNLNLSTLHPKAGYAFSPSSGEYDSVHRKNYTDATAHDNFDDHPIHTVGNPFVLSERNAGNDDDVMRMERKRRNEEARIAREVEVHEKKVRKELERQDMLRRKREEQIRKEMERQDRERRKEEERLLRERQREEEKYLKEQRRELLRREKFLIKETIRAEKMRQKEELRREKEAARLRAANERAIARKIAKESMELLEDERLELMELAASSKGLPSTLALDFETLQNLDTYRDKQTAFPPTSLKLKKPFAIKPWNGSEENVGNLLMVWRFLITFADVLGLWPCTLDEFAQAFHDHDPRLLGEVHIVLLRMIVKDIEDVARATSVGLGANQNAAAATNPGGGHPHIVDGAYAWGFDIRCWKRHLNTLTWPEILRQLSLSAGFGSQLKKKNIGQPFTHEENEVNESENVISSLRNGVAAEDAFAKMQERGFSNSRRSQHRLTPGTVKFAAFHILSFEGENGLNILEVAEKIQISGLRDLTTSKTPEASIAAALSRDMKLFERVAPSTYCVRAPYRKDNGDAEAILAEARERIRIFKSGTTDVEDVDEAAGKDEDSESDVGDDPEVDDLGMVDLTPKVEGLDARVMENSTNRKPIFENGKLSDEVVKTESELSLSRFHSEDVKEERKESSLVEQYEEDDCFDESKLGESWVEALVEGEYSELSVEERLNALVSLIGVAIEGNTIRVSLEERLESTSALKKQMWAEVQLDKRRIKEEFVIRTSYPLYLGTKREPNITIPSSEERESPLTNDMHLDQIRLHESSSFSRNDRCDMNDTPVGTGNPTGVDNFQYQNQGYVADKERMRAQLKAYVGYKAEELYMYRSLPLGQDRRRNRYWRFTASASRSDPGCSRIFVELRDSRWRIIDSEEGFDSLVKCLDVRGVRESHLHFMLRKIEVSFKESVGRNVCKTSEVTCSYLNSPSGNSCGSGLDSDTAEISTTFNIESGSNPIERQNVLQRYRDFEKWMWVNMLCSDTLVSAFKNGAGKSRTLLCICGSCGEVYLAEGLHCPGCGQACCSDTSGLCFAEQVARLGDNFTGESDSFLGGSVSSPPRIRLIKMQLSLVESSLPSEGLGAIWMENLRKSWALKLISSKSPEDLLQVLTTLESALRRDYLSSDFETTSELLGFSEAEHEARAAAGTSDPSVLPWIPKTTAAIALRLFELNGSIACTAIQKTDAHKDKKSEDFIVSEGNVLRNDARNETPSRPVYAQDENWAEPSLGFAGSGRGGRPRGRGRPRSRGGKSERKAKTGGRRALANSNCEGLEPYPRTEAQSRVPAGRKRGRRSARSCKRPTKGALGISNNGERHKDEGLSILPAVQDEDGWNEPPELPKEEASSSGRSFRYNYEDNDGITAEVDDLEGGDSSKLAGRGEFNLRSDEEEDDMNGDDGDEFRNEDSDGEEPADAYEKNSDGRKMVPYEDPDLTSSSSSGFID